MALSGGWIAAIIVIVVVVLVIAALLLNSFGAFGGKKMGMRDVMGGWDDDMPAMTAEELEEKRLNQIEYNKTWEHPVQGYAATSAAEWGGDGDDGDDHGDDYGDDHGDDYDYGTVGDDYGGDPRPVTNSEGFIEGGGVFRLKVSDPEYTALLKGEKTVEARLDRAPFNRLTAGDPVVVVRARPRDDTSEYPGGRYKYNAEVVRIKKYASIEDLLTSEGHAKVYPGRTRAEGLMQFGMYLPPGTLATDAVMAIELREASGDAKPAGAAAAPRARKAPKKKAD